VGALAVFIHWKQQIGCASLRKDAGKQRKNENETTDHTGVMHEK
jgi:hypothetical protein